MPRVGFCPRVMLIAEKGLEGLRTRDVAARAQANISTLHYYFGTKDALVLAVVHYVREKFVSAGQQRSLPKGTRPTLAVHLRAAWRTFQTTPHLSTVLQELVLKAQRDPDTRAAFQTMHLFWNSVIEGVLTAGIDSGELRADLDARSSARVVSSFIMGAMVQLGVNPKAFEFNRVASELVRCLGKPGKRP